jgi:predicted site-specific integrase-resolvase
MTSEPLMTNAEAAKLLGIRSATLRKWRHLGRGPRFVRYGSGAGARCYYQVTDIKEWLQERTFRSTAEASVADATRA